MAAPKRKCCECGEIYACGGTSGFAGNQSKFLPINSFLYDGYLPICNFCIEKRVRQFYTEGKVPTWNFVDHLSQILNIKVDFSLWEKLQKVHKTKTFLVYANMMHQTNYEISDWSDQNQRFLELQKDGELDEAVPELRADKINKLKEKWGFNYSEEDLLYLENLLSGIIKSQDVNGAKSYDEAKKLCKVSLLIEERIRAGDDFDKLLRSYESLTKIADFTPKNARNVNDFDSVGELFAWLERRGWVNQYYDGTTQDIVDNTMKNMQTYLRNLYINESSISEEIDRRLEALHQVNVFENKFYDDDKVDDYDKFELEGYNESMEEFEEDA